MDLSSLPFIILTVAAARRDDPRCRVLIYWLPTSTGDHALLALFCLIKTAKMNSVWQGDVTAELSIFSTSLILTFLHTVFNSFLLPVHSTGNLIYTCTGHIRFSHTITLTSLITSLRPHLGGIAWRGRNPQAWSHLICSRSSDWFEMMSRPPFSLRYWLNSEFPLMFSGSGWLPGGAGAHAGGPR